MFQELPVCGFLFFFFSLHPESKEVPNLGDLSDQAILGSTETVNL
jgi:hypothetical protein